MSGKRATVSGELHRHRGRHLRDVHESERRAGLHRLTWTRCSDTGQIQVLSFIYFFDTFLTQHRFILTSHTWEFLLGHRVRFSALMFNHPPKPR